MNSAHYRFRNIEQIKEELKETIFDNDLKKKILNSLESFSGKVVNVKVKNYLKECFPDLNIWISESNTEKRLRFSTHDPNRAKKDYEINLISKGYYDVEWPRFDFQEAISKNGFSERERWILKVQEGLESGHWERYFQLQKDIEALYNQCKAME